MYRYLNYLKANGLNISDVNIYNYTSRTMKLLEPLYDKMIENLYPPNFFDTYQGGDIFSAYIVGK